MTATIRIPVKYFIIVPICLLVAVCNFFVAKTLTDSFAESKLEIFTEKNITNLRTILPTLALSIWEFNVDRVASTLTGIDDGQTFIFASVWADNLEFSFRGDRDIYGTTAQAFADADVMEVGDGQYLVKDDRLVIRFPIVLQESNYDVGYILAAFHLSTLAGENRKITDQVNSIAAIATIVVLFGIIAFSWFANLWLRWIGDSITDIAWGELQNHTELRSPVAEFQDIDLALHKLRANAMQLIELRSKARSDEKIRHMAMHDALTNLANRRYLDEHKHSLGDYWQQHREVGEWLEVLHIDLDGFKEVNDTCGHAAGDQILQIASERLQRHVAEAGKIFRVGGDEFVLIRQQRNVSEDMTSVAHEFATGLIKTLGEPYIVDDRHHCISASVGLVITDVAHLDIDTLLFEADIAMYLAKAEGRNRVVEFTEDRRAIYNRKRRLAHDLDNALEAGQIEPYYQPKVSSKDYKLCGAEALVRWNHPELGVLTPDKFLTLVEERELLLEVDRLVFKKVCVDLQTCESAGYHMPTVSINLSSSRLNDRRLLDDLRDANLAPGSIAFELLETVYFDEVSDDVLECLDMIRQSGVQIELDDFGSGHASMISLLNISPDRLKIDRRFVREMLENAQSENMISKIVEIGKSLNIPSTAEGVESEEEAQRLAELGCDVLQGYYFGKPCEYKHFFQSYICVANASIDKSFVDSGSDSWRWSNAS